MSKQRNIVFDIAKFFAIYLVVLGHLLNECAAEPAVFINFFHMPVLFCISGYFAASSIKTRSDGELLKKRVKSLLIPYVFWSAVSLLANIAFSVLGGSFSPQLLLEEATQIFLYARSVWFLVELFFTFAIFLGVNRLLRTTGKVRYEVPVHVAVWILLTCFAPDAPFAFYKFKWLYPFFFAGYLFGKNRASLSNWLSAGNRLRNIECCSLVFPLLVFVFFREDIFHTYTRAEYQSLLSIAQGGLYYAISATGIVFLMTLSRWTLKSALGRLLGEIGTYSMDIYVIHMFLIKLLVVAVGTKMMAPLAAYAVFSVPALLMVLAIWILCKWILRKIWIYREVVGLN